MAPPDLLRFQSISSLHQRVCALNWEVTKFCLGSYPGILVEPVSSSEGK